MIARALVVATVLALSASTFAEEHYDRARELARAGQLDAAIVEFEAAYQATPRPEILFNLGALHRRQALLTADADAARRAIGFFTGYIERHQKLHGADPTDVGTVQQQIIELRNNFRIREAIAGTAPEAPAAQAVDPALGLPQPPPPAAAVGVPSAEQGPAVIVRRPSRRNQFIAGGVLLGIGGVAAITGGALLGAAGENGSPPQFSTLGEFERHVSTFQNTGIAMLSIGGAALIAGAVVMALPRRARSVAWLTTSGHGGPPAAWRE